MTGFFLIWWLETWMVHPSGHCTDLHRSEQKKLRPPELAQRLMHVQERAAALETCCRWPWFVGPGYESPADELSFRFEYNVDGNVNIN